MKLKLALVAIFVLIPAVTYSALQIRTQSVQPPRIEAMRNLGLDSARSGIPVSLPREWGRLVSVQPMDGAGYAMFLQNDGGEIYVVNLIQRGQYLYLNTYDAGGTALVINRHP